MLSMINPNQILLHKVHSQQSMKHGKIQNSYFCDRSNTAWLAKTRPVHKSPSWLSQVIKQTWSGSPQYSIAAHSVGELIGLSLHTAGLIYLWSCHPVGNNPMGRRLLASTCLEARDSRSVGLGAEAGWGRLLENCPGSFCHRLYLQSAKKALRGKKSVMSIVGELWSFDYVKITFFD